MRALLWRITVVGLVALPFVAVVGHPWAVATLADSVWVVLIVDDEEMHSERSTSIEGVRVHQIVIDHLDARRASFCMTTLPPLGRVDGSEEEGDLVGWGPTDLGSPENTVSVRFATLGFGFPFVSCAVDYSDSDDPSGPVPLNGIPMRSAPVECVWMLNGHRNVTGDIERVLPTRIVWHGVLLNLAIYAVVSWMLVLIPMVLLCRRACRRRWASGRCGVCQYEIGTMATCPECGAKRPGVIVEASA